MIDGRRHLTDFTLRARMTGSALLTACGIKDQDDKKSIRLDKTRQDKTRQGKARQRQDKDKTRQDKTRQDKTRGTLRQDKTRHDKTRQDKTRQDKTRGKIRQDETRSDPIRSNTARMIQIPFRLSIRIERARNEPEVDVHHRHPVCSACHEVVQRT
jgi:hypothetical protein